MNSKHRSRTLSKSTTMNSEAYALNTLNAEVEAVKGRKMGFSRSYHNLLRFLVRCLSPQSCQKRCFSCCWLSDFHYLVSFKWFVIFFYRTNRADIVFKSWHLATFNTFNFSTFLTWSVQTNVLLRWFTFFELINFMKSPFFINNYIIDSIRPPHTIF